MSHPHLGIWRFEQLERAKMRLLGGDARLQPTLDRLPNEADAALQAGPVCVVDKTPLTGDCGEANLHELDVGWVDEKLQRVR